MAKLNQLPRLAEQDEMVNRWYAAGRPSKGELGEYVGRLMLKIARGVAGYWHATHGSHLATIDDYVSYCFVGLEPYIDKWNTQDGMSWSTWMFQAMKWNISSCACGRHAKPLFGPKTAGHREKLGMNSPWVSMDVPPTDGGDDYGQSLPDDRPTVTEQLAISDELSRMARMESVLIPMLTGLELMAYSIYVMAECGATQEEIGGNTARNCKGKGCGGRGKGNMKKDLDNALGRVRIKAQGIPPNAYECPMDEWSDEYRRGYKGTHPSEDCRRRTQMKKRFPPRSQERDDLVVHVGRRG